MRLQFCVVSANSTTLNEILSDFWRSGTFKCWKPRGTRKGIPKGLGSKSGFQTGFDEMPLNPDRGPSDVFAGGQTQHVCICMWLSKRHRQGIYACACLVWQRRQGVSSWSSSSATATEKLIRSEAPPPPPAASQLCYRNNFLFLQESTECSSASLPAKEKERESPTGYCKLLIIYWGNVLTIKDFVLHLCPAGVECVITVHPLCLSSRSQDSFNTHEYRNFPNIKIHDKNHHQIVWLFPALH